MSKQKDDKTEDCVRIRMTYDKWGNVLSRTFYDENWRPDTITGGIHRYVYTKTLYGNTTSVRAEGLDGSLAPGQSTWRRKLDNDGNCFYYIEQDAEERYWPDGTCLTKARYEKGQRVWEEKYTSPNGVDSVLTYRYVRTPSCDSIFHFDDGYVNIERYDGKRRVVSNEYYNLSMKPIQRLGYHKLTTIYTERPGISIIEKRYLDEFGQPCEIKGDFWRKYNVDIITHDYVHRTYSDFEYEGQHLVSTTEVDSVKKQRVITKFKNGRIFEKYANDLGDDCANMVGLLYYDSLGYRGRTFKSDALYYNARKYSNIQGNTVAWKGLNEFGEPSYILNGDWDNAGLYCTNVMGDPYYYDEKGDTIPRNSKDKKIFKDSLHKAFCIELISPVAFNYGLRTGDLIVRYGDWHFPQLSQFGRYYESLLCLESVRTALKKKTMVVMRHDGETGQSRLIEMQMPQGSPRELGFLYHMLYLTDKERKRYEEVIERDRISVHLDSINTEEESLSKIHFFTPYKIGDNSDKALFMKGFQDNVVVIAWEPHVNGESYLLTYNNDLIDELWKHSMDSVTIHYTIDGKHVLSKVLSKKDVVEGGRRSSTKVGDGSDMEALADSLQIAFDERHPVKKIVLKPHDAAEQLLKLPGTKKRENDGFKFRGEGNERYGNVNAFKSVTIDYDSLSCDEMFLAKNIINNIDFSDYCYMHNDKDYAYLLEKNSRFTECAWSTTMGIVFLSDSVDFYNKMLITAEVVDSGYFHRKGLDGKYAILKCNDWVMGRKMPELSKTVKAGGTRSFVFAKLEGEEGNYSLGKIIKTDAPDGFLGIKWGWENVSDETFRKAYKYAKRYKRNR